MGESGKFSLIDLGDLSRPATTLIEKISAAIGGLYKPFQIKRVAQAEADADKIRAAAHIEISELEHRAMSRLFAEEAKKQHNIEAITLKALPYIRPESRPESIEDDWITNFFDKCRLISDEQMQSLWARIIAGEANSPGKFSKRTVNIVGSLDKLDATLFSQLCAFVFDISGPTPLIFDFDHKIYTDVGINFSAVTHLESAGVIHLSGIGDYLRTAVGQKGFVYYFGSPVWIEFPQEQQGGNQLHVGHVLFTKAGEELAPLSGAQPRKGFVDFVKEYWKRYGITTEPKTTQQTVQSVTVHDPAAK
jgi:hypothetical protein